MKRSRCGPAVFLLAAISIPAAPILERSNVQITAVVDLESDDSQTAIVNYTDDTALEIFSNNLPGWGPFSIDRNNPHNRAFMSSRATGTGLTEVGVSGINYAGSGDRRDPLAAAFWSHSITNAGTTSTDLTLNYEIPRIDLWTARFGAYASSIAEASMLATVWGTDGSRVVSFDVFNYRAHLYWERDNGGPGMEESPDLEARDLHAETDSVSFEHAWYDPIVDSRFLITLEPGERIDLRYVTFAWVTTSQESGGQAYIGDPFTIGSSGAGSLLIQAEDAQVPEPHTAGLFAAGGVLLIWLRRRRP